MKRTRWLMALIVMAVTSLALAMLGVPNSSNSSSCCVRNILIAPIAMPKGQKWDFSRWITAGFWRGITGRASDLSDCPLICEISDSPRGAFSPSEVEYVFKGRLSVELTGYEEEIWEEGTEPGIQILAGGGSLIGDWTLHMKLLDNFRGTVLHEGEFKWNGTISNILVQRRWNNETGAYEPYFSGYDYPIINWAESFLGKPLDDFLYEYERIPKKAKAKAEKDPVEAGDIITIELTQFTHDNKKPPQPWQRIVVEVEKGEILNGDLVDERTSVFEVGQPGAVLKVEYKAPEECENVAETVTVYNSCEIDPKQPASSVAADKYEQITNTNFDIVCDRWQATITYTEQLKLNVKDKETRDGWTFIRVENQTRAYSLKVNAILKRIKRLGFPGLAKTYDTVESEIELSDTFSSIIKSSIISPERRKTESIHKGSWNGSRIGRVPLSVYLLIREFKHSYRINFGDFRHSTPSKWGINYTYEARSDSSPGADRYDFNCRGSSSVFYARSIPLNIFVHVPKNMFTYKEGQKILKGSYSWARLGSTVREITPWSQNPACTEEIEFCDPRTYAPVQCKLTWTVKKLGKQ